MQSAISHAGPFLIWAVSIYLDPEVPNIIQLYFFFTKSNHKSSRIELQVLSINWGRQYIMMIQILSLLLISILNSILCRTIADCALLLGRLSRCSPTTLTSPSSRSSNCSRVRAVRIRHLCVEDCVRLSVVELFTLLVIHTAPQEVNSLVEQVDVSERFQMDQDFDYWTKWHICNFQNKIIYLNH